MTETRSSKFMYVKLRTILNGNDRERDPHLCLPNPVTHCPNNCRFNIKHVYQDSPQL